MTITAVLPKAEAEKKYGKSAAAWLKAWDAGKKVWSIEMGGMGEGYEQCIQVTIAEVLRYLIKNKYDKKKWIEGKVTDAEKDELESASLAIPGIKQLQLSGAQWGAGASMALKYYLYSPAAILNQEAALSRLIQVSKTK